MFTDRRFRLRCAARRTRRALLVAALAAGACNPAEVRPQMSVLEQAALRQRALDFIHRAALSDIDVVVSNALEALVQIDPEGGVRHFRSALGSESPLVRFAGCVALGEVRDCGAMERLERLARDEHRLVRLGADFALFRCGDRQRGFDLTAALLDKSDEKLRSTAAMLIGRLDEPAAIAHLRLAANDASNLVAVQALGAMARLGDGTALERVVQFAQGDTVMRLVALQTLVELARPETRDALLYRLSRPEEYIQHRLIAARALGRLGAADGFDLALQSLSFDAGATESELSPEQRTEETVRVRSLAALALGDIGDPRALPALRDLAAGGGDPRVQLAACAAICRIIPAPLGPRPTELRDRPPATPPRPK